MQQKIQFPIEYMEANIIVTPEKEFWAGYEVNGFQYAHKTKAKKKADFLRLLNVFSRMKQPFRLMILPRVYSFHKHFKNLEDRAIGPFQEYARQHARDTRDWLVNNIVHEEPEYKAYFLVKIGTKKDIQNLFDKVVDTVHDFRNDVRAKGLKNYIQRVINNVERTAGVSGFTLTEEEINKVLNIEKMFFHNHYSGTFNTGESLIRLHEEDIEWMTRRNFWKGIGEPPKSYIFQSDRKKYENLDSELIKISTGRKKADITGVGNKKVIRPRKAEFIRMAEGLVNLDENHRYIKITQNVNDETRISYSSYLTVSELPEVFYTPGTEWLNIVYDIPFPIGISVYVNPIDVDKAKKKVANKGLDLEDQESQTEQGKKRLPLDLLHAGEEHQELEKYLADTKYPLLETSITFEVFANNEEEMLKNRELLIGALKDLDIEAVCPAGNQWMLFQEFIPGASFHNDKDYVHPITPHVLAASMFGATNKLGDGKGYFIGFQAGGLGLPVFYDPSEAPRRNRSASATFTGDLGGGKSYTANLIGGYLMPLYGGRTLILDPKGDRVKWKDYLLEFESSFEYVTLDDREEDKGKLDPYGFLEPKEASRVANDIITFLADIKTSENRYIALSEAINVVENSSKKSMYQIIRVLEQAGENGDPDAAQLAKHLRAFQRSQFGELLFYDGELNKLELNKSLTILTINNLSLPDYNTPKNEYQVSEVLSVALMIPICSYAIKFSMRPEFTTVLLDEAWAVLGSRQGRSVVNRLIRTGRSLNAAVFIISQNVRDLEEVKKNIGTKFIFKVEDHEEIDNILEYLELEKTEENRDLVRSIDTGRPLMRDLDGRVGLVDINVVYEHVDLAFTTTPDDVVELEKAKMEEELETVGGER
jgi:hypothetical protein